MRRMTDFLRHLVLLFTVLLLRSINLPCLSASMDDPVSRLKAYLRIETVHPNPNYKAVTHFLVSQADAIGLESQALEFVKDKPVVLMSWAGKVPSLPSILLNSHTDVVPTEKEKWIHDPFSAFEDAEGNIYARGAQDMKGVGMQYLEAIRTLRSCGFQPLRSIHISFVPDEEIGGKDGIAKFTSSSEFQKLNIGVNMDEGLASAEPFYRIFFGERSAWKLIIKATGAPGHGSKLYDGSAFENMCKSLKKIYNFRDTQFQSLRDGLRSMGDVIAINNVYLKAGTPTPTTSEAEAGFDIRLPTFVDGEEIERRVKEDWAPASRNFTYKLTQEDPQDSKRKKAPTTANDMNPWWTLLAGAVSKAGGKLGEPMIRPSATDARYLRNLGIPAFGFSPIANTPSLLHDHSEQPRCLESLQWAASQLDPRLCEVSFEDFLNVGEYLKGIRMYTEIIKDFSSYVGPTDPASTASQTQLGVDESNI